MNTALYEQTKALICEVLEISPEELAEHTHFIDELGIDSILIIELKTRFEEKYAIEIDKSDLGRLTSLSSIFQYLAARNIDAV